MYYNPHRNYDKGMDDAYIGLEPLLPNSQQYMEGYEYSQMLNSEPNAEGCDTTDDDSSNVDDKIKL